MAIFAGVPAVSGHGRLRHLWLAMCTVQASPGTVHTYSRDIPGVGTITAMSTTWTAFRGLVEHPGSLDTCIDIFTHTYGWRLTVPDIEWVKQHIQGSTQPSGEGGYQFVRHVDAVVWGGKWAEGGLGVAAANLDYFRTIFGPMLAMLLHPNEEATLLEHLPQSARAAFESFVAQDGNVGTRRAGK